MRIPHEALNRIGHERLLWLLCIALGVPAVAWSLGSGGHTAALAYLAGIVLVPVSGILLVWKLRNDALRIVIALVSMGSVPFFFWQLFLTFPR